MGQSLIWIESLAAALVLIALAIAIAAHWQWFGRWAVPIAIAVGFLAVAVAFTAFSFILHSSLDNHPLSNPHSLGGIAWSFIVMIGSAILLVRGLRRAGPDRVPAAQEWSRARLAVAATALIVVATITLSNMDLAVKIQLAALRAEAGAKTLAILPPRPADSQNAALVYQEAFDLLAPPEPVPAPWLDKRNAWQEYDRTAFEPKDQELREFLRTQERGLALVRKAAAMPGCSFAHDYSKGFEMPMPDLSRMRRAAILLAYDALTKAEDGDAHGALADVAAIYGIVGHINDPVLISGVVAANTEKTGAKGFEDVLAIASPAAADLSQVSLPDHVSHRRALRSGLAGAEALDLAFFETFAYLDSGSPALQAFGPIGDRMAVWAVMSPFYRLFLLSDDLASYRRAMAELQHIAGLPYAGSRHALEAFGKFFNANHGGLATRLLVPSINRCVERAWAGDTRRALARTALALATFKAKTGSYPEKLDALVPDFLPRIPLDPFSGRPIRLKREGAGVVVFSAGRGLQDGDSRPVEPETEDADLVFHLH